MIEILWLTEVYNLIKDGKKKHKKILRIKVQQVERCYDYDIAVFQRTDLQTVENSLKHMKYSFRYETNTESIPAEQSVCGGTTLRTTFLVIKL